MLARHCILVQQCLTSVRKTIFSSLTVANHLSWGRIKSTSIALNVLAPYITPCLLDDLINCKKSREIFCLFNKLNI